MRNCYTALCRSHQDKARALFWLIALASRTSRSKLPALIPRKQISFDHKQYSAILPQAWSIKQTLTSSAQLLNSRLCMVPSLSLLLLISLISTAIKWNLTNLEACCCFGEMNFKKKTLCLSAEIKNPSVYCFVVIFRPSKLEYGERVFKYSSLYWKAVG